MNEDWRDDPWILQQIELATGRNPRTKQPWRVLRVPWYREGRKAQSAYERELGRLTGNDSSREFKLALLSAWASDYQKAGRHIDDAFTLGLVHENQTGDASQAAKAARLRHLLRAQIDYRGI